MERSNAQLKFGCSIIIIRRGGDGHGRITVIDCLTSPAGSPSKDAGSISHFEVYWEKQMCLEYMPAYWLADPYSDNKLKYVQNFRVLFNCKR